MSDKLARLLMSIRQASIIEVGAIEDYLDMKRSITPRHKRVPLADNETITGEGTKWDKLDLEDES